MRSVDGSRLGRLLSVPLYPFFLAGFPVVALLAHNIEEVPTAGALRPLILGLMLAGAAFVLAYIPLRNIHKAALLGGLAVMLFFSYGHVYGEFKAVSVFGFTLGRHRFLLPLWSAIGLGCYLAIRRLPEPRRWTPPLNLAAFVLLLLPVSQIGIHAMQVGSITRAFRREAGQSPVPSQTYDRPDIYYIILDAYTRADVLRDEYALDVTPFFHALTTRGFYIARCSQSNYARTSLSLASSLNMTYVQDFLPGETQTGAAEFIQHNPVRTFLEERGYRTVAIESGYLSTEWSDADIYLDPHGLIALDPALTQGFTEFEGLLLRTTALAAVLDNDALLHTGLARAVETWPKVERYNQIAFILDALGHVAGFPGPKFVFAHVRIPHDPYIFSANGGFLADQTAHNPGYPDQVRYVNSRILPIVDEILGASEPPPVIILQGDHGSSEFRSDARRMAIFNAYLVAPSTASRLYATISPVNSFRLLFADVFGADLEPLPDVSYLSLPGSDMDFSMVPNDAACDD